MSMPFDISCRWEQTPELSLCIALCNWGMSRRQDAGRARIAPGGTCGQVAQGGDYGARPVLH